MKKQPQADAHTGRPSNRNRPANLRGYCADFFFVIGHVAAEVAQHELAAVQDFLVIGQVFWAPCVQHPVNPAVVMKATERRVTMDFMMAWNLAEKSVCASGGKELS